MSKRHSSYAWAPSKPRTPPGGYENTVNSAGGRPETADKHPKPQRIRPSMSATGVVRQSMMLIKEQPTEEKKKRWFWFGRSKEKKMIEHQPVAWVIAPGHTGRIGFDVAGMMDGRPVKELWDDLGTCYVHLFPRSSGKGPSFRIDPSIFASSATLTKKAFGKLYSEGVDGSMSIDADQTSGRRDASGNFSVNSDITGSANASLEDANGEVHLWLDCNLNGKPAPAPPNKSLATPLSEDAETLIAVRNLFAFLAGQSIVATEKRFTLFSIFMRVADLLQHYDFGNMDGSSFGEVASASFDQYVSELGLSDVRKSSQKTVEMIALGERMRSIGLYNEAFTHAAGKFEEIQRMDSSVYDTISPTTQTRLQRAAMDLDKRISTINTILTDFDFPAMFSGIANSRVMDEARLVSFDAWKSSFFSMRRFLLGYCKERWGSWPPRPNPKKNTIVIPGLNRMVLRELYSDVCAVYDLLVDRSDLTNRTADGVTIEDRASDPPRVRALRHLLSEYDRSTPPVKPPIPFDLPALPSLTTTRPEFGKDKKTDKKLLGKNLKSEEVTKLLSSAHNQDALRSPFVSAFIEYERAQAKGNTINGIVDLRYGQWIFVYAVLQALPFLVVDAPGVKHTEGVEYFLCEASRGGVPWARDMRELQYYSIAGGGGIVSLPADVIENSVEGVYRRSHCWRMAEKWSEDDPVLNAAVHEQQQHHDGGGDDAAGHPTLTLPPQSPAMSDVPQQQPPPPPPSFRLESRNASVASGGSLSLVPPPMIPAAVAEGGRRVDSRSSSPARSKRSSVLGGLEAIPIPRGMSSDRRPRSMIGIPGEYMSFHSHHTGWNGGGTPGTGPTAAEHAIDPSKTFDAILGGMDGGVGASGKKGKGKK